MTTDHEPSLEGRLLWEPSAETKARARITAYFEWLRRERGLAFDDYATAWRWSVTDVEAFWQTIVDYFGLELGGTTTSVLSSRAMPGARWFDGATVNYAEHALRRRDDALAVVYRSEDGRRETLTFAELADGVARARAGLAGMGVGRGDRVVAYMPNAPETLIAFLAAASLGATWSSCSPEFGVQSVLDRFTQIAPKVLIAVDGYPHGGKTFDRGAEVEAIRRGLPTLTHTVLLARSGAGLSDEGVVSWEALVERTGELAFDRVPFDHPLWILYSSGTTGLPKPIVQGHGGILLEHAKALALHCDLGPGDRFFWFSTTGWMMWNFLVSGLVVGSTLVLYEGSPGHPDLMALWRLAEEEQVTYFGTSAPFLLACRKAGLSPGSSLDLSRIRALGSTGAPLPADGFAWVYEAVGRDLLLGSVCGGTDVCTAFVLSCPLLPVHAGELQVRGLGCKVEAYAPGGVPVIGEVGECVITEPMPSMPLFFWNDPDGERYRTSYFDHYPGIWRHGDWIKITDRGSSVVYGRSDATLNRGGVRMGTSEFYRVVEALEGVKDSLVVDTGTLDREGELLLFVVPRSGELTDALVAAIRGALRKELSPRHVPDRIHAVTDVPRTLSGKKLEIPVRRILAGEPLEKAVNAGTLANPACLSEYLAHARG